MTQPSDLPIPSDAWLETLNNEYRDKDIDVKQRPQLALDRYLQDFQVEQISLDSAAAKKIFDWFSQAAKPGAHHVGSLFTGVFYYDSSFWAVDILIGYGLSKGCSITDSLRDMSSTERDRVANTPKYAWPLAFIWADCLDFAYGFDDLQQRQNNLYALEFLKSAEKELRAAVSQLLEHRPNVKAAMSSRMSTEIMLKSFLAYHGQLDDKKARKLNHDLEAALEACRNIDATHPVLEIQQKLSVFPKIGDRYATEDRNRQSLWEAYSVAQYTAAAVVRSFTDRNMRVTVMDEFRGK